jgi:hypothetical protein
MNYFGSIYRQLVMVLEMLFATYLECAKNIGTVSLFTTYLILGRNLDARGNSVKMRW